VTFVTDSTSDGPVAALDLKAQYSTIKAEVDAAIRRVVESQHFILGPEVAALEAELAHDCAVPHAIGCASGSDALLLPLMAWEIGPGDEVITTPYTFFATASAIWRLGARPVFVDIEPDTYNIDARRIEAAITSRTRAIIPVHLFGHAAPMEPILHLARSRGIHVLEDAAQAIGATHNSRPVGSMGEASAFSFYPSKNLGGFGDAGLVTTGDPQLARQIARLRVHGMEPRYHHHEVGINSRLDALQAAVLRVKRRHLAGWTEARRSAAQRYDSLFRQAGASEFVKLPIERPNCFHVYNQYVIAVPEDLRDGLRAHLDARRISTEIYYPIPLHLQRCFAALGHGPGDFPVAELAARQTIALPLYPELSVRAQEKVVAAIMEHLERSRPRPSAVPRPHILVQPPLARKVSQMRSRD
jgi:dTDP-4-amino-4,6-dideoxygalactose transaminase